MGCLDGIITLQGNEYRPCMITVGGIRRRGLFHKWIQEDRILYKFNSMRVAMSADYMKKLIEETDKSNIMPGCMDIVKYSTLVAVIELEDGTVEEIEPEHIKFLDSDVCFKDTHPETID